VKMGCEEFVSFKHTASASEPKSRVHRGGSPKLRIFNFNPDFPPAQNTLEISFPSQGPISDRRTPHIFDVESVKKDAYFGF